MNASVESLTPQSSRLDLFLRRSLLDKLANIEQAQISITDPLGYYELGSGSDEDLHAEIIVADLAFIVNWHWAVLSELLRLIWISFGKQMISLK